MEDIDKIDKDAILLRVKRVIFNFFPEFEKDYKIFVRKSSNSIIIESVRESEKKDFYFSLSLLFENSEQFTPSLCCVREIVFNSRPGRTILLDQLEEGIDSFLNTLSLPNPNNLEYLKN
jgi:hypothetical protein